MKIRLAIMFLFVATMYMGCSAPHPSPTQQKPQEGSVDFEALRQALAIHRDAHDLGYIEKAFDTCQMAVQTTHGCQRLYYIDVQFRLQCRDSEGTISTPLTESDLQAVSKQTVKWNLKGLTSETQTDAEGYGHIEALSPLSQANQRLRLTVGNDFLYLRAKEISRVVAPRSWCKW